MRIIALALLALLGLAGAALAEEESGLPDVRIDDPVPGHPGVTYEALVKQILPDLKRGEEGRWVTEGVSLRKTEGDAEPSGPGGLSTVSAFDYRAGGKDLILLIIGDFSGQGWVHIVAVFDPAANGAPKLIDAVNAGIDRLTLTRPFLFLSADETALVFDSSSNTMDSVKTATEMVLLHEGKLKLVLLEHSFESMGCGVLVDQLPELSAVPDPGAAYGAVSYAVTQEVMHRDEDCGGMPMIDAKAGTQVFTDVFHWDAATASYVAATNNRARLVQRP